MEPKPYKEFLKDSCATQEVYHKLPFTFYQTKEGIRFTGDGVEQKCINWILDNEITASTISKSGSSDDKKRWQHCQSELEKALEGRTSLFHKIKMGTINLLLTIRATPSLLMLVLIPIILLWFAKPYLRRKLFLNRTNVPNIELLVGESIHQRGE